MDIDSIFPYFVGLIFAAIVITFVVNVIRHGGFKAAIFGAPIERTVGEVRVTRGGIGSTTMKVHVLRKETELKVGLEVVTKSVASYHMMPFTLTASEAKRLSELLEVASSRRS